MFVFCLDRLSSRLYISHMEVVLSARAVLFVLRSFACAGLIALLAFTGSFAAGAIHISQSCQRAPAALPPLAHSSCAGLITNMRQPTPNRYSDPSPHTTVPAPSSSGTIVTPRRIRIEPLEARCEADCATPANPAPIHAAAMPSITASPIDANPEVINVPLVSAMAPERTNPRGPISQTARTHNWSVAPLTSCPPAPARSPRAALTQLAHLPTPLTTDLPTHSFHTARSLPTAAPHPRTKLALSTPAYPRRLTTASLFSHCRVTDAYQWAATLCPLPNRRPSIQLKGRSFHTPRSLPTDHTRAKLESSTHLPVA